MATAVAVLLSLTVRAQTSPVRATANPPATSTDPIITLDEFSVTTDRDNSYKATNVLSGTRFNTTLLDLPKALDVVTREFMEDIGARDITEALQYTSGIAVTRESDSAGKTDTEVLVRGFTGGGGGVSSGGGNQYIDGYRTFGNFDPISIERIEILKGPSSLFSGAIGAGGGHEVVDTKSLIAGAANGVACQGVQTAQAQQGVHQAAVAHIDLGRAHQALAAAAAPGHQAAHQHQVAE